MMETIVLWRKRFFAFLLALIMVLTMFPDAVLADGYTDTTGIVCEHTLEPHAAVSANCMEAGNTEYWECSKCHHCFTDEDGSNETPDAIGFTIAALGSNQANGHDLRDDWAIAGNVGSDGKISGGENDGLFICNGDSEGMLTYERFCHRANCTYRETEKHGIDAPHEFSVDFTWGELEQQYGCIATIFCSICGAEENTLFAAGNSQHYDASTCEGYGYTLWTATFKNVEIGDFEYLYQYFDGDKTNRIEDTEPLGHSFSNEWTTIDGASTHWHECTRCHNEKSGEEQHAVSENGWTVTPGATCADQVANTGTCSKCNAEVTVYTEGPGHDFENGTWVVNSNDSSTHVKKCKNCDAVDATAATAHNWGENDGWSEDTATCTAGGTQSRTCSVCGKEETRNTNSKGHDWSTGWTQDEKTHWHSCSRCTDKDSEADHTWGEWSEDTATCTAGGTQTRACSVCGKEESRTTQALDHDWATDWTQGENTHWHSCSRCTDKNSEADHTWGEWSEDTATCTAGGTQTRACSVCGKEESRTTQALDHEWSTDWTQGENTHWHSCSRCTDKNSEADHTWGDWTTVTAATANTPGKKQRVCGVCGHTESKEISLMGGSSKGTNAGQATENDANTGGKSDGAQANISTCTSVETYINSDGSEVETEQETSTSTTQNADGSTTVTDTVSEVKTTTNTDGSTEKVETESKNAVTTASTVNDDGTTTKKTNTDVNESETITNTDKNGTKTVTKIETESKSVETSTDIINEDGSVTTNTGETQTITVTKTITDEAGNSTKTVEETNRETTLSITTGEDGTISGTGTETVTTIVTDESGNILFTAVTESEITITGEKDRLVTTQTVSIVTKTDTDGNETVEQTVTTEQKTANGSTGTTVKDKNGNIISQETTISQEEAEAARDEGRPARSPLSVTPVPEDEAKSITPVQITLPHLLYDKDGDGFVSVPEMPKVEIRVTYTRPGVIGMFFDLLSRWLPIKESREGSIIFPIMQSGTVIIMDNTKAFTDVPVDSPCWEAVTFVTAREIMHGDENGAFAPDTAMTRAMVLETLYSFARDTYWPADASADECVRIAEEWAVEKGIVRSGEMEAEVTRQDLTLCLFRFAEAYGYDVSSAGTLDAYPDAADVAANAKGALLWAAGNGLLDPAEDSLNPQSPASRAFAASLMMRFVRNAR